MPMRVPLLIEMNDKNVLVIGGGGEGVNRARKFSQAKAKVKVLSLEFDPKLKEIKGIDLVHGDARDDKLVEELVSWSDLVVVALSSTELNNKIVEFAKKHGTLYNLANDADATEVVVPFEGNVDGIRIALTSEGKSGLVVRDMLKEVKGCLTTRRDLFNLLNIMHEIKLYLKKKGIPSLRRIEIYKKVYSDQYFQDLSSRGKTEEAWRRFLDLSREVVGYDIS